MSELGFKQLFLDFSVSKRERKKKFILSEGNKDAFLYLASWPHWLSYANIVHGPKGSGKTYIASFWGSDLGAVSIDLYKTSKKELNYLLKKYRYFIFDDFDFYFTRKNLLRNLDKHEYESFDTVFKDILDYIKSEQKFVFLTSNVLPNQISFQTADLQNRISEITKFSLYAPDASALRNMYEQKFLQYKMVISKQVINYLVFNSRNSFKYAEYLFEKIKDYSFSNNVNLSLAEVKSLISS
jgi:chromosomal replication initiation ATPase DnaA